jgi:hypothetical protein
VHEEVLADDDEESTEDVDFDTEHLDDEVEDEDEEELEGEDGACCVQIAIEIARRPA